MIKNVQKVIAPLTLLVICTLSAYCQTGIPCGATTFWGDGDAVVAMSLNGNVVTVTDTVINFPGGGFGLALCNNLENNAYSPTFYKCSSNTQSVSWYNGSGWTNDNTASSYLILNAGGNGSYLYFTGADMATYYTHVILTYNGNAFTTTYTLATNRSISVADIMVDDGGSIWVFTGPNDGSQNTDSLEVISPAGKLLHQYSFSYNTDNAYGAFLLNGTLYMGLGPSNSVAPNAIVPVIIKSDSAIAGTPIAMPANNSFDDLASCNAGSPLGVKKIPVEAGPSIFPNPADDEINLAGINLNNGTSELRIFNIIGKEVFSSIITSPEYKLQTSNFENGIYFVELRNENGVSVQEVLVQH